jgi:hypothetical protein
MKIKLTIIFLLFGLIFSGSNDLFAKKKKVAQSGMTYLAISMGARESAMGDAACATVKGINGMWHNPAVLADIDRLAAVVNQVNWLADTKLYGAALAYSFGEWGTVGLDVTYMDFGEIMGTQRVDKSVDYRGFILTGDLGVQDYAFGLAYSLRINDRFAMGVKVKKLHERLGNARYVWSVENEGTDNEIKHYRDKVWSINNWGLDFGTIYNIGWNGLTFAMTMQNFSPDMKYWYEEFNLPMLLRMGLVMDISNLFAQGNENLDVKMAVDALHPNDYTERIHLGSEIIFMKRFAFRGGYKFNHDVESLTLGIGVNFEVSGLSAMFDYAYTNADFFDDINRVSIQFSF